MTNPKIVGSNEVCISVLDGLVRVDSMPVFKLIVVSGELRIQFMDGNKFRSEGRGTSLVELPLNEFITKLEEMTNLIT